MQIAHSLLLVTKTNNDAREIVGLATSPVIDAAGDCVVPEGAQFKLPIPVLWAHDATAPVGWVVDAKVAPEGITATLRLAQVSEPGTLKNRLDEVWGSVRAGLVRGLSIGFQSLESEPLRNGGRKFKKWAWRELSLVVLPCNELATISAVRSADGLIRRQIAEVREGVVYLDGRHSPRRPAPRRGVVFLGARP